MNLSPNHHISNSNALLGMETKDMKTCTKCNLALPLSAFSKQSSNKGGLAYRCRSCAKEYKRQYLEKNGERVKAKQREMQRLGLWQGSSRKKSSLAQNVEIDPETDPTGYKLKAVRAVFTALRNGTITRLHCQCCGAYNTEAHHADYSLPLAVTWLCKKCHTQLHNEHRDMLRDMASAEITT